MQPQRPPGPSSLVTQPLGTFLPDNPEAPRGLGLTPGVVEGMDMCLDWEGVCPLVAAAPADSYKGVFPPTTTCCTACISP